MKRFLALFVFAALSLSMARQPETPLHTDARFEGDIFAPELPEHLEWLNTSDKLKLKDFRGKFVLLDFWTYCCINCMHVIPDLKKLEAKYSEELVVIGVHSAKFFNEKGTESIRQAILRYEIEHPVVNDKDLEVWEQYAVTAWPTLVLINPEGKIVATHAGEQVFGPFDSLLSQTIPYFEQKGKLKRSRLKLNLESARQPNSVLSFPGKIYADSAVQRLFISDSNHNRILIADLAGKVLETIGSGETGEKDGSFEAAQFNHPQGVFAHEDKLYIADTENHLIREADLKTREVKTLFSHLRSPWDLLVHNGKLYIAMAGAHQIYAADLVTMKIVPYAGSGREALSDGPLREAALAQPSGITTDTHRLYFADSEVSAIRSADLNPDGNVETIIGKDLFEFGDVDGDAGIARLQHPLGVVFNGGMLYVADTYNSKIKEVYPFKKLSQTYAGSGVHGYKDGALNEAQFFEPGGITILGDKLYIADTNNHQIRVLDRKTKQVSTLNISGLDKVAKQTLNPFKGRSVTLPKRTFKEGKGTVSLTFKLPKGYKFAEDAPFHVEWEAGETVRFTSESNQLDGKRISFPLDIPVEARAGKEVLRFEAVIYYCREDSKLCFFDNMKAEVPVEVKASGPSKIDIQIDVVTKA